MSLTVVNRAWLTSHPGGGRVIRALVLLLAGCSVDLESAKREEPIVDGRTCVVDEHPSAVVLIGVVRASDGGATGRILVPLCGGALIASDVVVTAAHCLEERDLRKDVEALGVTIESISFGVSRQSDLQANPLLPNTPDDLIVAHAWEVHPAFDYPSFSSLQQTPSLSNYHDIGLLFLSSPASGVAPARLLEPSRTPPPLGSMVSIIGWGLRKDDALSGDVSDRGIVQCAEATVDEVDTHEIRLGGRANKCQGDSGSPTFWVDGGDTRIVGLGSHLLGNHEDCTGGSVDVRPEAYASWLVDAMVRACDEGHRSECATPEPTGFVQADAGMADYPAHDGGSDSAREDERGCRATGEGLGSGALSLLVIGLLLCAGRRNPRTCGSRP